MSFVIAFNFFLHLPAVLALSSVYRAFRDKSNTRPFQFSTQDLLILPVAATPTILVSIWIANSQFREHGILLGARSGNAAVTYYVALYQFSAGMFSWASAYNLGWPSAGRLLLGAMAGIPVLLLAYFTSCVVVALLFFGTRY